MLSRYILSFKSPLKKDNTTKTCNKSENYLKLNTVI